MKFNIGLYIFLLTLSLIAGACGALKAGQVSTDSRAAETEKAKTAETAPVAKSFTNSAARNLAGDYELNTYKTGGEGLINSLVVEEKTGGKVSVSFMASFNYQANGATTFHEASGGGELEIKENTATGEISEEAAGDGKKCPLTITFAANEARVKTAEDCVFGVSLDGVYRRKADRRSPQTPAQKAKVREIQFERAASAADDFKRYKTGERFIITNVPKERIARISPADDNGNKYYRGLYYLQPPENAENSYGVGAGFLASEKLVNEFATNPEFEYEAKTLRVTAVLIESGGEFDIFRTWFAVRLESVDATGETISAIEGTEPKSVKLRH